jgi:hypothetical protein
MRYVVLETCYVYDIRPDTLVTSSSPIKKTVHDVPPSVGLPFWGNTHVASDSHPNTNEIISVWPIACIYKCLYLMCVVYNLIRLPSFDGGNIMCPTMFPRRLVCPVGGTLMWCLVHTQYRRDNCVIPDCMYLYRFILDVCCL